MKKQHVILPTMLLVGVLAACGGESLSQAEAVARAQKIQDYHDSSSFAFDFSKYTFTSADVDPNTGNMSSEIRSIKGVYYYSKTTVTMQLGSATSAATELTAIEYLYSQNGAYYEASDDGMGHKSLNTLASKDTFGARIVVFEEEASQNVTSATVPMYANLKAFITFNTSSSSSTSSSSLPSDTTLSFGYASTGEGNITITVNASADNSGIKMNGTSTVTFNNNLPESMTAHSKGNRASASTMVPMDTTADINFKWGTCEAIYPNPTDYSSAAA